MPKVARFVVSVAVLLLLTACQMGDGITQSPPASILGGTIKVATPSGFCVDKAASRESGDSAVILMGRCNTEVRAAAALVSVAVGRSGSGGVMTQGPLLLAEYFKTAEGRAALSRNGRASGIEIRQVSGVEGTLFLLVRDRMQGEYWRAITSLGGRLITVSATGTPDIALDKIEGRKLVDATLLSISRANPAKKTAVPVLPDS